METEKLELADGTVREVPTEEALKQLQAGHDANKTKKEILTKLMESVGAEKYDDLVEKVSELKEAANPNWQKARQVIKRLKSIAKEKGIEVDDDGNIVGGEDKLSPEKIQEIAAQTAAKELEKQKIDAVLANYTEEEKKAILGVYEKLSALGGTVEENLGLAISKVVPNQTVDPVKQILATGGGQPPKVNVGDNKISDELKEFAKQNFGLTDDDFNKTNK